VHLRFYQSIFVPVSPPPYLDGGPEEFFPWAVESTQKDVDPGVIVKWLEGRLPNPVEDLDKWKDI